MGILCIPTLRFKNTFGESLFRFKNTFGEGVVAEENICSMFFWHFPDYTPGYEDIKALFQSMGCTDKF